MTPGSEPAPRSRLARWLRPHPELCSALDPAAQPRLEQLHHALESFYNSDVVREYFATADAVNETWGADFKPHGHLTAALTPGASVLDVGCGSAPAYRHWSGLGLQYTGVDWSRGQVVANQRRWPEAEWHAGSLYDVDLGSRQFDAVVSLYVIEHLVWPHRAIAGLQRLVKPGGLLGLLTPPFRYREYLKSFDYGLSARPFADKVKQLRWLDAALHFYQHRVAYPRLLRRQFPRGTDAGRFLIHLNPVCLTGAPFFPDSDAVYLSDTQEILDLLTPWGEPVAHWPEWGYLLRQAAPGLAGC